MSDLSVSGQGMNVHEPFFSIITVSFPEKKWLQNYAWRVPLGSGILLLSCFFTLFLVLLTFSSKIIKIAEADPIDSLRYE